MTEISRPIAGLKAAAAFVVMALFMIGIPMALTRLVGNPLPTVIPSWSDFSYAISSGQIDAWTWVKIVACVAWVTWAQLAAGFLVEIAAAARGVSAAAVNGLGATQWIAARVVGSFSLAMIVLLQSTTSVAVAAVPLPVTATTTHGSALAATASSGVDGSTTAVSTVDYRGDVAAEAAPPSGAAVPVARGDTLWSLAAAHLDDGERWVEIRDSNVGRTMADGTVLAKDFAVVRSGWDLIIPGLVDLDDGSGPRGVRVEDAATASEGDSRSSQVQASTLEVGDDGATGRYIVGTWRTEQGDHFWKISKTILAESWGRTPTDAEIHPYWVAMVDANHEHLISDGHDPNVIFTDQQFEVLLPPVPAASDATLGDRTSVYASLEGLDQFTPATPVASAAPAQRAPAAAEAESPIEVPTVTAATPFLSPPVAPSRAAREATTSQAPAPTAALDTEIAVAGTGGGVDAKSVGLGLFGTGVGGGALLMLLRMLRRQQAARRRPETTIDDASAAALEFESRVRPVADTEAIRWLGATNQYLSQQLGQSPAARLPAVVAMRAGTHGIELLLDEACAPVKGFIAAGEVAWRLHPDTEVRFMEAEAGHAHSYCPALLPVGETDAGDLLFDFEQLDTVSVVGDEETIIGWFRSLAVAVTSVAWARECEVVAIGVDDALGAIAQVTVPADPVSWAEHTAKSMAVTAKRLQASTYEQRVKPGEIHHPMVVLVGPGHEGVAQHLGDVSTLAYSPIALVAAAPLAVVSRIEMQPQAATLEPVGLEFKPTVTTAEAIELTVELLAAASETITIPTDHFLAEGPRLADAAEPIGGGSPTTGLPGPAAGKNGQRSDAGAEEPSTRSQPTAEADADALAADEPPRMNTARDADEAQPPDIDLRSPTAWTGSAAAVESSDDANEAERDKPESSKHGHRRNGVEADDAGSDADRGATDSSPAGPASARPPIEDAAGSSTPNDDSELIEAAKLTNATRSVGAAVAAQIEAITAPQPIEVEVLAPKPHVHGLDERPPAKIEAVIIYLGYQRSVPSTRLREVFWPASVNRSTTDNAMSRVRRRLGSGEDGETRLALATNSGRYEISDEIGCDWRRVEQLLAVAKTASDQADQMALLEAALRHVKGKPGDEAAPKHYGWLRDDHEVYTHIETVLVDAAYRLGELSLAGPTEDPELARWAADQGLMVVPGQEALHRIQMRAASMAGDEQGVEDAYRRATASAEAQSAWEEVQPETEELYAKLTRRQPAGRSRPAGTR